MDPVVQNVNSLLALGTVALQLVTFVIAAGVLYEWIYKKPTSFGKIVSSLALPLILVCALAATVLSLVYSEVFGFIPCSLCWVQRIFMYPLVIISLVALIWKDKVNSLRYVFALAVPGFIVALYQHYLQMGGSELVACPAGTVSCAQRFLFEFGYITFPMLAAALFSFVIVLVLGTWVHNRALRSAQPIV